MLKALALIASVSATPTTGIVTPQCEYYQYMAAGVWSALDDAERAGVSLAARNNLESTLRAVVAGQRKACARG